MQKISEVKLPKIYPITTGSKSEKQHTKPKPDFMRLRLGFGGVASSKRFETFDESRQPEAYEAALSFLSELRSLVFLGPNGVGKTHLALAIGNALLDRRGAVNVPVLFITFDDALRQIRKTFQEGYDGHGEWHYIERWTTVPVLILDEVGQAGRDKPAGDGEFTRRIGYDIIDGRYRRQLPLVLTTNKNPNELCEWITRSAVDRLFEVGRLIRMEGKSWRQDHQRTSSNTKSG